MLIDLHYLVQKYNIKFYGILHIGSHECEEIYDYEQYLSRDKIVWVDALIDKVVLCKEKFPGILIEHTAVSDCREIVKFNRSNNGQSSSLLDFGLHKYFHPEVNYVDHFYIQTSLLKNIIPFYNNLHFNFINLDIQGAELKALKGMGNYLYFVDYIYTEVNTDYVYEGCCLVSDLDYYLTQFGFIRVETKMTECHWGDALYINSNRIKPVS
jgi:FkbM family methyltransferase